VVVRRRTTACRGQSAGGRRGFALLDALIGGVLLGLAMVVILGLTGSAISSQARGEQLQIAAMLADERLNLVLAVGPEAYPSTFETKGVCDEPFSDYSYAVEITPRPEGDPFMIKAIIKWRTVGGRAQELAIETLIAPRVGDDPDPDRRPEETVGRTARQAGGS